MLVYIGADHRGFKIKESLKKYLQEVGHEVSDVGNYEYDPSDDYPDFAMKVAKEVSINPGGARGILICGSGVGVDIAANKYHNVRSVLANNSDQAIASRRDDDTNVLSLGADFLNESEAEKIVSLWLQTNFSEEDRHRRRLEKIKKIEEMH